MTVPLMIWSALTVIDSHACSGREQHRRARMREAAIARDAAAGAPTTGSR